MAASYKEVLLEWQKDLLAQDPSLDICFACNGRTVKLLEDGVAFDYRAFGSAKINFDDPDSKSKLPSIECSYKENCLILALLGTN